MWRGADLTKTMARSHLPPLFSPSWSLHRAIASAVPSLMVLNPTEHDDTHFIVADATAVSTAPVSHTSPDSLMRFQVKAVGNVRVSSRVVVGGGGRPPRVPVAHPRPWLCEKEGGTLESWSSPPPLQTGNGGHHFTLSKLIDKKRGGWPGYTREKA